MAILSIQYLTLSSLKPDPKNPRKHSARQIKQIAQSIEAFGFNVPVLINANHEVIAGHGRVAACQKLGWAEVPVISLEHLTPAQAKAFMIADNRLTENSEWDDVLLAEQLQSLSIIDLNFCLEATGFTMGEIDLRIESATETNVEPVEKLPPLESTAVSKLGDLWILGRHRLLCDNSLDAASYETLFGTDRAVMIFTDVPYNVKINGHVGGLGGIQHREFAMAAGEMDKPAFIHFLTQAFGHMVRYSTDGSLHFQCIDWRHMGEMLQAGEATYSELKNCCVWVKDNAGMGSLYRSQHELVFVFKNCKASHRNNVQLGTYGRYRTNVWNYPGSNSFSRKTEEGNLLALHPTVKPLVMVADAILDCTARGDIVLDSFLGSGTTLMAAERTGRICYGLELDPLYVDATIRRWQAYTGGQAIHIATGNSFDAIAAAEGRHEQA